ncbi:MAG: hypothetical protein KDG55_08775 [Rhodocyclaceae bacterium]|nr:hypothetical protein [Rhodocyclaceae bacterium]
MFDLASAYRWAMDNTRKRMLKITLPEHIRHRIRRDWRNGERVPLLARRYHLAEADVWRVLNEEASHG